MVAARAEVARLAGVGEQVIVSTGIAVDAGKAVMWVAAGENALERLLFDRAPQPARLAQLVCVPLRALSRRACARTARAVKAAGRPCGVGSRIASFSRRLATRSHPDENAPKARRAAPTSALDWSGKVGSTDRREPALKKVSQSTMGTAFPSTPDVFYRDTFSV